MSLRQGLNPAAGTDLVVAMDGEVSVASGHPSVRSGSQAVKRRRKPLPTALNYRYSNVTFASPTPTEISMT